MKQKAPQTGFGKQSFFRRLFLSFVAVSVLITLCITTFMFTAYRRHAHDLVQSFYERVLSQANFSVTYMNDLAKRLSSALYADKDVIAFLNATQPDNMATVVANTAVRKITLPLTYVESVYLYNGRTDVLLSTRNGEQTQLNAFYDTEMARYLAHPELLATLRGRPIVHSVPYLDKQTEICSYVLYDTQADGSLLGALVINLSTATLTNSLDEMTSESREDGVFMVADENGRIIGAPAFYTQAYSREALDAVIARYRAGESDELFTVTVYDKQYLTLCSTDNVNGWLIIGLLDRGRLLSSVLGVALVSILGAAALFLLVALLCLHLARRLHSPVQAITRMVRGQAAEAQPVPGVNRDEFAYLEQVFSALQAQNQQLESMRHDAQHTLHQDFLTGLVNGRNVYTLERTRQLLRDFGAQFIAQSTLCLCVLKLDNYRAFTREKSQQESWAYRYAVVNIACELLREQFTCEVVNTAPDRFVALIDCAPFASYEAFQPLLHAALERVGASVDTALALSLTTAYSGWFQGLDRLPSIYTLTAELTKLKMRCGNGCVISPQMLEDAECEPQEITPAEEELLRERVFACDENGAAAAFSGVAAKLATQSYSEVVPYLVHLVYLLYHDACGKYPALRDTLSDAFRTCVAQVSDGELLGEITACMQEFLQVLIKQLSQMREEAGAQGSGLIVARVLEIIARETANKALCLNFIAEELGLSANYVGTLFKNAQGVSVARYLQELRMERVAQYLKDTRYPLPKILELVGLEMNNYFYTSFKKHFGMSMGKYKLTVLHQTEEESALPH